MVGYDDILVMPEDLLAFAWSAPMRDLAAKIGMSDVGLKKLLRSHGIVTPPQGYWNKVHAGRPLPPKPAPPPRRPGQTGRVRVDRRFATLLPAASRIASAGPFASDEVPEDLNDLLVREMKAIGRRGVPRTFDRAHPSITKILEKDRQRAEKSARDVWAWDKPKFIGALDMRRLRILNAVFLTLAGRGHAADAYERDGLLHTSAYIGQTQVSIALDLSGSRSSGRRLDAVPPQPDLPANTPLTFHADLRGDGGSNFSWGDAPQGKLENMIARISAGIIVAGEAKFRRSLREAEENEERRRAWEIKRRQEMAAEKNRKRLEDLHSSATLLRQAEDLRALIVRVRTAMASDISISEEDLSAWEAWATGEADRMDPVMSGQILSHLRTYS